MFPPQQPPPEGPEQFPIPPPEMMDGMETPAPTTPLGPETTDMDVIEGKEEEKPLFETDEARLLLTVVQEYDRQEEFVRLALVKKLRKHLHYWNSLQYLAWDYSAHDWMTPEELIERDPQSDIDPSVYAKVINVYKAHGEILIGALTSGVPSARFFPKDADDEEDVTSAKAHTKIAELIQRHNKARLLLMKSLFIMYNQGMIACYNENKTDFRFGSYEVPDIQDVPITNRSSYCPGCGADMGQEQMPQGQEMPPEPQPCPECQETVTPEVEDTPGTVPQQVGVKKEPKNRECLEIYGPLNVKIPIWCRDQFSTPYLILETEEHVALMREIYPEIADKIDSSSYPDTYDKESRIPSLYKNDFPRDLCTVQRVWLRPWAFNTYRTDLEGIKALKETYKGGCYAVIINKSLVCEMLPDNMDDHWTISENPLSEVLHAEPLGTPMVPLQDITNELANLTLETIEFGLPEIFADPRVLDFDAYQRQEARPGQVSEATAIAGKSLGEGFHEVKAASLSREVELFADRITSVSQFVMGSYPSIYGGSQEGGSGTAKEYELSKSSALQRLSTTWTIIQEWWCKIIQKAVKSYVASMREDERFVQSKGSGFENVWIRRVELSGEVGDVEPEISETFPISWTQKRDVLLNLIQMGNEDIAAVIRHPENASLVATIIGVPELYIPGDDDRNKQLFEIAQMIKAEPMEIPPMPPMPGMPPAMLPPGQTPGLPGSSPPNPMMPQLQSSVPVDQVLDNHDTEAEVCRAWLKSEVGMDAKVNNPGGYMNVLTHLKEHQFFIDQAAQQAAMMAIPPDGGEEVGEEVGV